MENNLPVLILDDAYILPSAELRMDFDKKIDKKLFSISESYHNSNIIVVHHELNNGVPTLDELPRIGVVAIIKLRLEMPNGKTRLIIIGESRVKIFAYSKDEGLYEALFSFIPTEELSSVEEMAFTNKL